MLRSVEEWATDCFKAGHRPVIPTLKVFLLCADCARAYATERVAQARKEERRNYEGLQWCLDEIANLLSTKECCHGHSDPKATPPMMFPEWIVCVVQKAVAQALEAAYREAAPYTDKMRFTHMMVEKAGGELVKDLHWLDEFVVEPEWFPNEGDRQYWQERRAASSARREQ